MTILETANQQLVDMQLRPHQTRDIMRIIQSVYWQAIAEAHQKQLKAKTFSQYTHDLRMHQNGLTGAVRGNHNLPEYPFQQIVSRDILESVKTCGEMKD